METSDGISDPETIGQWSVRFRFHLAKCLSSTEKELRFDIAGRVAVIRPYDSDTLEDSQSLCISVHGFSDEQSCQDYAERLRVSLMVAAVETSNGVDPGDNKETSNFSSSIVDTYEADGIKILPNVHGYHVYRRTGTERILRISATASVRQSP